MKKITIALFSLSAFFAVSCHNYDREKTHNREKMEADSIRKSDSLAAETDSIDRVNFQKQVQFEIDSMQNSLNSLDAVYSKKSKKEHEKWEATRGHIQNRIERLKDKEKQAGIIAKEKWAAFKQDIDTAIYNIKYEWKNGE